MRSQNIVSDPERLSTAVVDAVATARDVEPHELEPPLGRALDADALDALASHPEGIAIQFSYAGHFVTFSADGTVAVDGTEYTEIGASS